MQDALLSTPARGIRALLGTHGEFAAGLFLDRLPRSWIPSSGIRVARRSGFDWSLDLADDVQRTLYLVGSYDALTLDVLRRQVQPTDVVLDIGANIGAFALPLAARLTPPGRVIAVEPAPDTAERLRGHVIANGLSDRVEVVQVALSDHDGWAELHVSRPRGGGNVGARTLEGNGASTGAPVRLMPGDELRRQLGVDGFDVVKIDVEGHEGPVLDGLAETFREAPPRVVVAEVVPHLQRRAGSSVTAVVDRLRAFGYEGRAIRHRGLRPLRPGFTGNAVFTRHS
jgi:FkbM family methyltransferase